MAVRLFIGNLPYGATEADLRAHFAVIGEPSQVVMPVDRETGRPRGFAFVEFADRAVAEEVIRKFNQQVFKGRPLAVSEARAREDRGPGGGRPPGGFAPRPGGSFGGPHPGGFAPRAGGEAPAGAPSGRERNFGPPAPPKGRTNRAKGKASYDQKPKGPIKVKPSGRIYAVDDMEDTATEDFDDFATSAPEDADEKLATGAPQATDDKLATAAPQDTDDDTEDDETS